MIGASHVKVHPYAAWVRGGNQDMSRIKRARHQNTPSVDTHGMPIRVFVTESVRADCKEVAHLIEDIWAQPLLAGHSYDTT